MLNKLLLIQKKVPTAGLLTSLFLIMATFSIINNVYMTPDNLIDILDQSIINGLLAIGLTLVIIIGGIDLSVGSIFAIVIVIVGGLLINDVPIIIAITIGIITGSILGLVNGFFITKMKLQPFIVTLGTMSVYRGIAYLITGGWPVLNIPSDFRQLMDGIIVGRVSTALIIFLLFALIVHIILSKTSFGTYVYAIGSNKEATRLSGVNVDFHTRWAYVICGIGAALSGMVLLARLGTGEPTAGQGYELNAIAAVAIGGGSLSGGKGSIIGTILGTILLSALKNGLIVTGVDTFWQFIATGSIIIVAVVIDQIQTKKQ